MVSVSSRILWRQKSPSTYQYSRMQSSVPINTVSEEMTLRGAPLRILHAVETLEIGGTETQAVQTAVRQAAAGHDVTVACLRSEGPLFTVLQEACISVTEFRKRRKLLSIQGLWQLFRLTCFLRRYRFDVLHCHDLMSNLLGVPAARLARTPKIISSRRYLDLEWWSGWPRTRIASFVYRLSHHVIVNSASIRDLLVNRDKISRQKISVFPNGIDIERFLTAKHKDPELSFLSSSSTIVAVVANMYSPVKGHSTLIKAAVEVCRHFPNVLFALIGDGKERPNLEKQVKDAGVSKNFLFLGSRKDVPQLLACCAISVLPSDSEGFPNALLEAMAARLPVIATSVGGVPEVIANEVTGLLVPPANPSALSAAILRLLNEHEVRNRLADAGHTHLVEHFSFGRLTNSLEALYRQHPQHRSASPHLQHSVSTSTVKLPVATHASE
jgi:L-malate glycosyltransferase